MAWSTPAPGIEPSAAAVTRADGDGGGGNDTDAAGEM